MKHYTLEILKNTDTENVYTYEKCFYQKMMMIFFSLLYENAYTSIVAVYTINVLLYSLFQMCACNTEKT